MTTALDIITLALKDSGIVGVGQTAKAEDAADAFTKLNWMLAQWSRKRWLVYHLIDKTIASTTGAMFYTIGPGGAIDVPVRPDKIDSAYARQLNVGAQAVDYGLTIIPAKEDYNKITLKTLTTWPTHLFYDTAYPLGKLYTWPIPSSSLFALTVTYKDPLTQFTTLNEVVNLPPEYEAAIQLNLTVRLAPGYQKQADPAVVALAADALATIRPANAQIPTMEMPNALIMHSGGYNIYSDQP